MEFSLNPKESIRTLRAAFPNHTVALNDVLILGGRDDPISLFEIEGERQRLEIGNFPMHVRVIDHAGSRGARSTPFEDVYIFGREPVQSLVAQVENVLEERLQPFVIVDGKRLNMNDSRRADIEDVFPEHEDYIFIRAH